MDSSPDRLPGPTSLLVGVSLKMYLGVAQTRTWLRAVADMSPLPAGVGLFVLPAFPCLADAQASLDGTGIAHGAQNAWPEASGPFTGEVSPAMLAELECRYVEVGHAERRRIFGEGDALVARKATSAVRHGLTPVLCVGEPDRLDPPAAADAVVTQLSASLHGVPDAPLVVAYEPVWAIGADEPAPAGHVVAVTAAVRAALAGRRAPVRTLYGGTAGPGTLTDLHGHPGGHTVDGLFLGRRAHDVAHLRQVLDEAAGLVRPRCPDTSTEATS